MKKSENTTGNPKWDFHILKIRMTQKTVPSKKLYKRKPRNQKTK